MMPKLKNTASAKTQKTGFVTQQKSLRMRAIEKCGLPAHRLKQMAGAIAGGFAHFADADDLIGETWIMQHENPELCPTKIAAFVVKTQTQKREKSIGAASLDHCDGEGESRAMQIAAPEPEEMEQWRKQEVDIDIDGLREEMKKHGRVGDRRIRQILQAATKKIASGQQPNLFGTAF